MAFDPIVANAGRLTILTALAVEDSQEFVQLRSSTKLTDGNLASHARRLRTAGLIAVEKQFRSGKPVTSFTLTPDGRKALENHTRRLVAAISHRRMSVAPAVAVDRQTSPILTQPAAVVTASARPEEDWVD
jgi:DNA-binding MarR family transcriptional regulator